MALWRLRRSLWNLLCVPHIRGLVGYLRFIYFVKLRRRLRTMESPDAYPRTVAHNLGAFRKIWFDLLTDRVDTLLRPLSSIETLGPDAKILVIGPRTEGDLLLLRGYGFHNIRGLDLITYSPWVDLGDMHAIPHEADAFDAVVCGWVIAYSSNPMRAASEITRVARAGALVAIGQDHSLMTAKESEQKYGYTIVPDGAAPRLNSVADILNLFGSGVGTVYYSHDAPMKDRLDELRRHRRYPNAVVSTIFSIRK